MLIAQHDGVRLRYQTKDRDGSPVDVNEFVPFAYTPTRFGGRRQWLRCLKCGRRCRKIYGGRYFGAGCAIACDTPRRAKRRISAPRTSPQDCQAIARQVGRCHRGRIRLPAETAAHALGDVQPPRSAI